MSTRRSYDGSFHEKDEIASYLDLFATKKKKLREDMFKAKEEAHKLEKKMQELQDEQHRTEEKLANAKYRIDEIKDALRNMHRKTSTELMQEFSEAYRAVNPLDKSAVMTVFTRHFVAVTMSIGSAIHASHADEIDQLVDDLIQADLDQQAMAMLRMMTRLYELNDL